MMEHGLRGCALIWADENDQYSGIFSNANLKLFIPIMNVPIVGSVSQAAHKFIDRVADMK